MRTTTTTTVTTRTRNTVKSAQDEFDTGSDSEPDFVSNRYSYSGSGLGGANSSLGKHSPLIDYSLNSSYGSGSEGRSPKNDFSFDLSKNKSFKADSSTGRPSGLHSPSLASEYAADKLNQIRSRLSLGSPSK